MESGRETRERNDTLSCESKSLNEKLRIEDAFPIPPSCNVPITPELLLCQMCVSRKCGLLGPATASDCSELE